MANDVLAKLKLVGKELSDYSRETVEMFYRDASAPGIESGFADGDVISGPRVRVHQEGLP